MTIGPRTQTSATYARSIGLAALLLVVHSGGVSAKTVRGALDLPAGASEARSSFSAGAAGRGHQFARGSVAYVLNGRVVVREANGKTRAVAAAKGIKSLTFLSNGHLIAARQSGYQGGSPTCGLYDLSASTKGPLITHRQLARQVTGSWGGGCEIVSLRDRIGVLFFFGGCAANWFAVDPATLTAKSIGGGGGLSVASDGARAAWLVNRLVCGTPAFVPVAGSLLKGKARALSLPIPVWESHLGRVRGFPFQAAGPVAISPSGATVAFAERTRTDVKLWAGPTAGRLAVIARPTSVETMHWSADGQGLIVAEKSPRRATRSLVSISYPAGRRLKLASISSSVFAVTAAVAPKAAATPRVAWVLPAIWGDPSPQAARAGLWFRAGRVARDPRAEGVPWRTWAVWIDDVGDLFLRFTNMRWRGWGTARVEVGGYAQLCYAGEPGCRSVNGQPAPRHTVRLVLTRLRNQTCGNEPRTLFYTRYRLLGMSAFLSRTNRSDRYC